jgi:hypothetical protein
MLKEYPKWIADFDKVVWSRDEEDQLKGQQNGLQERQEAAKEVKKRGRPRKTPE